MEIVVQHFAFYAKETKTVQQYKYFILVVFVFFSPFSVRLDFMLDAITIQLRAFDIGYQ